MVNGYECITQFQVRTRRNYRQPEGLRNYGDSDNKRQHGSGERFWNWNIAINPLQV